MLPEKFSFCEHLRQPLPEYQETYNPITAIADIWHAWGVYYRCCTTSPNITCFSGPIQYAADIQRYARVPSQHEILTVCSMALGWTIFRYVMTWLIYLPFAKSWGMHASNVKKYPESAFKAL